MTDIEQKALALVNEVLEGKAMSNTPFTRLPTAVSNLVLLRAIEQHEAFRQEVSDVVYRSLTSIAKGCAADAAGDLSRFIIPTPKPDPLVDIMEGLDGEWTPEEYAKEIRAALDAAGFEIREKGQ